MKILIATDMEGITGVVDWKHVEPGCVEYDRFRKVMTADVNAAVRGAFQGGADEVVVTDGHAWGRNILIEDLEPRAKLNCGSPSYLAMVEGIQHQVDAAVFVGYHARAGAFEAVLCHTWTGQISHVWLNGRETGEFGVNCSVAGSFGVPGILITGDAAVCAEAREWVAEIETVAVKTASGRYAAECLPQSEALAKIEAAACRAVQRFASGNGPKPLRPATPVKTRIEFSTPNQADAARTVPSAVRIDGRTIELTQPDMVAAYRAIRAAAAIGK